VQVNNLAPVVAKPANQITNEGAPTSFNLGSFSDAGPDSPWAIDVNWGDGAAHMSATAATSGTLALQPHTYADNGLYTVTVKVTDKDLAAATQTFTVTVVNIAPTASFVAPTTVSAGSSFSVSLATPTDPSSVDTAAGFTYAFDCGAGGGFTSFSSAASVICTTNASGTRTVNGRVRDKDGAFTEYTAAVNVTNVAPSVTAPTGQTASEGASTNFSLGAFGDTTNDSPWIIDVNWGDGSAHTGFTSLVSGTLGTRPHAYADNGPYSVTVMVTDKGGAIGSTTFPITVSNIAPTASLANTGPVGEGSAVTVNFTNQLDPSSADTTAGYHYAYACDGAALTSATYATSGLSPSTSCVFTDGPSSRVVRARIFDKDGGFTEYTTTVTVNNVPPTATFTAPASVNVGAAFTLALTASADPSSVDTTAGFTYAFDCGDGAGLSAFGSVANRSCPTSVSGTRTVRGQIRDKDGGTGAYTTTVTVVIPNLLLNNGFELDANADTLPDSWTTNSRFTRSTTVLHSGNFAGKHFATDNTGYTISQTANGLTAGQGYALSAWVNIPATTDAFTFKIDVQWLNASNTVLRTDTLKSYTAQTGGWNQATANLVTPTGTTGAIVRMVVTSLNATIYVDDFALQPSSLITNGAFEWDTNNDSRPDSWISNAKFTRSTTVAHSGSYAGKHFATDNSGYTISQTISSLSAGKTYSVSGWVNIPATSDVFTIVLDIQWRNSSNTILRTDTIKTYTTQTGGWDQATASKAAPTGTTNAVVRMVVTSLNATIYVDDFVLQ